jgi:metal-responsive CopG/Arc/MetJ family transcriptional regulator
MAAKPVQISLDTELLRRIDRDGEARRDGRSAFIRSAVLLYLEAKRRKAIDEQIKKAFGGKGRGLSAEVEELMGAQTWPRT